MRARACSQPEASAMTWTTERIELLKTHFDAGFSCAQIARRLGMTRNAVIGKLNRLGLSRPKRAAVKQAERRTVPAGTRRMGFVQHEILAALRAELCAASEEEPYPGAQRCSLLELTEAKCRWPIGEPGSASFGFCGNEQVKGLPYCAIHARMAYRRAA